MNDLASQIRDLCASMDRLAKAIESTRAASDKCDALASWGVRKADQPMSPVFAVGHTKPVAWLKSGEPVNRDVMAYSPSWNAFVLKTDAPSSHQGNRPAPDLTA